jgi:hypothetical protein
MGRALTPRQAAPLFWLTALVHAASVASRFDELPVPADVEAAILLAQFPLLFVAGWFESRIDYGPTMEDFPLWMRIRSVPVKLSFTFAFIYLSCVSLQALDVGIGPIDPTPPEVWGTGQRAAWFAMFTAGMFFPFYLAASGGLIPVLRALGKPLRGLPVVVAVPIYTAVGLGAGFGVAQALGPAGERIGTINDALAKLKENPAIAVGITLAMVWIPILVGWLLEKKEAET